MKVLGRTLIILFAVLLVVGATYTLGRGSLTGGTSSTSSGAAVVHDGNPPSGNFAGHEGHKRGGDHNGGGGIVGALEIGKNLSIITIIVALVAGSTALSRRIRPGTRGQEPPTTSVG